MTDGTDARIGYTPQYLSDLLRALRSLDVIWARRYCPDGDGQSDDDILAVLHLIRIRHPEIDEGMKMDSRSWLESHGCSAALPAPAAVVANEKVSWFARLKNFLNLG